MAWYVASSPDKDFLQTFLSNICSEKGIRPLLEEVPNGIEVSERRKDGQSYLFVLNHTNDSVSVNLGEDEMIDIFTNQKIAGEILISGYDLEILKSIS